MVMQIISQIIYTKAEKWEHSWAIDRTAWKLFKADIKEVYHLMWMRPAWQAKQAVTCGTRRHIDFCNCFRNRASYKVFLSFASQVTWIAEHVKRIPNLRIYIDNNCSFDHAEHVLYYHPYQCYFPANQSWLLMLWDELGSHTNRGNKFVVPQ